MASKLVPTTRLRFVERLPDAGQPAGPVRRILQQYFAEDMPGYMRDHAKGEWRDVEVGVEDP